MKKKSWKDYETCEEYIRDLKRNKMQKIYRRRRAFVALCVCLLITALISTVVFARTSGDISDYTPVVVEPGDTLWGLAAKYYPNTDRRDAIDEIKEVNELHDSVLHIGDVLLLPTI